MTQRATPFLWFRDEAEAAAAWYADLFGGRVVATSRAGEAVIAVTVEVLGLRLVLLNGNRDQPFTDAFSLQVPCADQAEIDTLWSALTADGGREGQCGWLKDRFGVSWQVVPADLPSLLANPRAVPVMLGMRKLDWAALASA
jgi:predicted 3-demethylubiquinone-9 3-methyltransferase (glyoxalase superfamily)